MIFFTFEGEDFSERPPRLGGGERLDDLMALTSSPPPIPDPITDPFPDPGLDPFPDPIPDPGLDPSLDS